MNPRHHHKLQILKSQAHEETYRSHGIEWLMGYSFLVGLLLLLNVIASFILKNKLFVHYPALRLVEAVLVVWLGFVLYGLEKRKIWVYKLALSWYVMSTAYLIVLFQVIQSAQLKVFFPLLLVFFVFLIGMQGLCCWYVYQKKPYFLNPFVKGHVTTTDRLFIVTLLLLFVLMVSMLITIWRWG